MLTVVGVAVVGCGLVACVGVGICTLLDATFRKINIEVFFKRVLSIYLIIGILLGSAMKLALPSISVLGVFYYALIWPVFVSAGTFHTPAPPIPAWCFHF